MKPDARGARIVDATLSTLLLDPPEPLPGDRWAALCDTLPPDGVAGAAPVLGPGTFGAAESAAALDRATVWEPVHEAAWRHAVAHPPSPGTVLVDPVGVRLGATPPPRDVPEGIVREAVVWIPADQDPARIEAAVAATLHALRPDVRLRLHDPFGHLRADTVGPLATRPHAHRLTLVPENARGQADAVVSLTLAAPAGPWVRTTLLGLGPRTGSAHTELAVDDATIDVLRAAAERTALLAGCPIPPTHPLWGVRRTRAPEPDMMELVRGAATGGDPVVNIATLDAWLDQQLHAWGLTLAPEEHARVRELIAAHLRPGDDLDGPRLWAILAGAIDLRSHATKREASP